MAREMRRLFRDFERGWLDEIVRWPAPLDVVDAESHIVIQVSLPGVRAQDIRITLDQSHLTLEAESDGEYGGRFGHYLVHERRLGRFQRTLRLPDVVDPDGADVRYEYGILTITLPKGRGGKSGRLEIKAKS